MFDEFANLCSLYQAFVKPSITTSGSLKLMLVLELPKFWPENLNSAVLWQASWIILHCFTLSTARSASSWLQRVVAICDAGGKIALFKPPPCFPNANLFLKELCKLRIKFILVVVMGTMLRSAEHIEAKAPLLLQAKWTWPWYLHSVVWLMQ